MFKRNRAVAKCLLRHATSLLNAERTCELKCHSVAEWIKISKMIRVVAVGHQHWRIDVAVQRFHKTLNIWHSIISMLQKYKVAPDGQTELPSQFFGLDCCDRPRAPNKQRIKDRFRLSVDVRHGVCLLAATTTYSVFFSLAFISKSNMHA